MPQHIIPKLVEIGTVHGFCDARCIMCPIATMQEQHIMNDTMFQKLVQTLSKHKEIERINLVGMGETILDKNLVNKVKIVKAAGLYVAIITNGHALSQKKSQQLLEAGLDEILFSVDSQNKKTYEQIRIGLSYDRVIKNVHDFIVLRDEGSFRTRILIRIILQDKNAFDVEEYIAYWSDYLSADKSDMVLQFPEHNWPIPSRKSSSLADQVVIEKQVSCSYIFDRLTIDSRGNVQFCCVDNESDFFELGNVFETDPIALFNGPAFQKARELMNAGRINDIDPCKFCNVPVKRAERSILRGENGDKGSQA